MLQALGKLRRSTNFTCIFLHSV